MLTFDLKLLGDHKGLNSKSEVACIIPRGKPFRFPEVSEDACTVASKAPTLKAS